MSSSFEGIDDAGWKAKLKLPPQDHRIKTSVRNIFNEYIKKIHKIFIYKILL